MTSALAPYEHLIGKYAGSGILIDTNLLLVYFVGEWDPNLVAKYDRTSSYDARDYLIIKKIMSHFSRIISTPNILTETSDLLPHLGQFKRGKYRNATINMIRSLVEHSVDSHQAVQHPLFGDLCLADTVSSLVAQKGFLILTGDLPMYLRLVREGIDVINYNHVRLAA